MNGIGVVKKMRWGKSNFWLKRSYRQTIIGQIYLMQNYTFYHTEDNLQNVQNYILMACKIIWGFEKDMGKLSSEFLSHVQTYRSISAGFPVTKITCQAFSSRWCIWNNKNFFKHRTYWNIQKMSENNLLYSSSYSYVLFNLAPYYFIKSRYNGGRKFTKCVKILFLFIVFLHV